MTDRDALLASVLASPDDDAPRLVYADWLEEHGEPERAEFVRRQCRGQEPNREVLYARVLHTTHDDTRGPLHLAEGNDWPIPDWWKRSDMPAIDGIYTLWHGFVWAVTCSAADWLAHGDRILAEHPVTTVRLTTMPDVEVSFGPFDARPERGETHPMCVANLRGINKVKGVPYDDRLAAEALLAHVWPRVKTWTLPPGPRAGDTLTINGQTWDVLDSPIVGVVDAVRRPPAADPV